VTTGYWKIPREWAGRTAAVLASGPSMSAQAADKVHQRRLATVVVNNTFALAPWADILYAADSSWWNHTSGARSFDGLKVSCEEVPGILRLRNAGRIGYTDEPDCVHTYGNSGAQAIQIAAKAGASRILLLGFDMQGTHWHGSHPLPLRNSSQQLMRDWCEQMAQLATALAQRSIQVLNCTPGSALTCFPMASLERVLASCPLPHS
jgi:hypothetical protein